MIKHHKYKPTGIELLEGIPSTWTVGRLKDVSNMNEKSLTDKISKDYQFKYVDISNVTQNGLIQEPETVTFSESPSRARRIVRENDIIISTVRTYLKAIAFFDFYPKDYIVSTGFAVLSPNKKIDAKFLSFYSQSELFVDLVIRFSTGVSYPAINSTTLSCLYVYLPSKEEQIIIAKYLDTKIRAIEKKINLLTKKTNYYQELHKSIINAAVCKGLDKNVKLKASGIEWIEKIPEHWKVKRLKDAVQLNVSNIDKHVKEGEKPVLLCNYTDVYKNNFITSELEFMSSTASDAQIKKFTLKKGDLLITKDSETFDDIAVPAIVTEKLSNVVCGYHLALLRAKGQIVPSYLFNLFRSSLFNYNFSRQAKGITRVGLGINSINDTFLIIPPIEEQVAIAKYLDEKTQKIDAIVTNIGKQIETLKELRKTLINDVVTGKIKVTNN